MTTHYDVNFFFFFFLFFFFFFFFCFQIFSFSNPPLYFHVTKDPPNGTLYLEEYTDVQTTQDRPKIKNCFALIPKDAEKGRTFYFSAETAADMNDWINIIQQVLAANSSKRLKVWLPP